MKPVSLFLLTLSFSFVIDIMIAKYLLVDVGTGSAVDNREGKNRENDQQITMTSANYTKKTPSFTEKILFCHF